MWGVTLNPGSHHRQKNRGVTRNWSAAPRLINAETKRQSRARRLSVGLFSFRASWGSEQLTRWQGQETPPQSAGNGNLLWAQHTVLGSFVRCRHLSCSCIIIIIFITSHSSSRPSRIVKGFNTKSNLRVLPPVVLAASIYLLFSQSIYISL